MNKAQKMTFYMRFLLLTSLVIFVLLISMEVLPLLPNNTLDSFRLIGQQRSLSLRMIKDSLTLAYRPNDEHAEALDELQKSIGPWEQTQSDFYNGTRGLGTSSPLPSDSFLLIQQSEADFSSMDAAFHQVLARPEHIDPLQITILIAHANPYFLAISQSLTLLQTDIENMAHGYFVFELALELLLAFCILLFAIGTRKIIKTEAEVHL